MKDLFRFLNNKSGFLANLLAASYIKFSYIKKHLRTKKGDYYTHSPVIVSKNMALDAATAFYINVLLEGKYDTAIEIGSYDGARILEVKKNIPFVQAYGLDIAENYKSAPNIGGVSFRYFDHTILEQLAVQLGKKIILSRGTLTCFNPVEIDMFLNHVKSLHYDLFLFEPATFMRNKKSTWRTSTSFYHPYSALFEEKGMKALLKHHEAIKEISAQHEAWYVNLLSE
jgi:hypothetical protein